MDTELLVDGRIEDGQKLVAELIRDGFDVTVAFWVRISDPDKWLLYIASPAVDPVKIGYAYGILYVCLSRIPDIQIDMGDVKLVPASNPTAGEALTVRERYRGAKWPARYHGKRLGDLAIEEAIIYPKPGRWFKGFDEIKERFPSAEAFSLTVPSPGSAADKGAFPQGFAPYMGKVNDAPFEGKDPGTVLFMGPAPSTDPAVAELVFVYRPEGWDTVFHLVSGALPSGFRPEVRPTAADKPLYDRADFHPFAAAKIHK